MKLINILKIGWQYRWFTVDAQTGALSYYICDNPAEDLTPPNIVGNTPRWQVIVNLRFVNLFKEKNKMNQN